MRAHSSNQPGWVPSHILVCVNAHHPQTLLCPALANRTLLSWHVQPYSHKSRIFRGSVASILTNHRETRRQVVLTTVLSYLMILTDDAMQLRRYHQSKVRRLPPAIGSSIVFREKSSASSFTSSITQSPQSTERLWLPAYQTFTRPNFSSTVVRKLGALPLTPSWTCSISRKVDLLTPLSTTSFRRFQPIETGPLFFFLFLRPPASGRSVS